MSEIKYIKGNALEPIGTDKKHIVHICNNLGYWGRGFVVAISSKWNEPERQYKLWSKNSFAEPSFELGNIQSINVAYDITIVNMIAQDGIFRETNKTPIRYDALETCLTKVVELRPESVHMPRIGCGLAGGKWPQVEKLIEKTLIAANIQVYVYDLV